MLIVGAGPTGLAAGCLLQRYGVPTRIVDRRPEPGTLAKAMVLWSRSLEILDELGLARDIAARSIPLAGARYRDRRGPLAAIRTDQLTATGWPPRILPQHHLEALLGQRYRDLGGTLDWGCPVTALRAGPDQVDVTLHSGRTTAGWLIGCDGMRSTVRAAAGIDSVTDTPHPGVFVLGDVSARTGLERDVVHHFLGRDGFAVLIPMPGGGWRMIGFRDGYQPAGAVGIEALQGLLAACDHEGTVLREVHWSGTFQVARRLAARFRAGRVLLAGDAAHVHSPAGGQGLNTGLQDAYNLAWKLALVAGGQARESLLDSYDRERRPVAREVLRVTRRQDEWIVGVRTAPARLLRRVVLGVLTRSGWFERTALPELAQLTVDYRDSPLTAGRLPRGTDLRLGRRVPSGRYVADGTPRLTLYGAPPGLVAAHPGALRAGDPPRRAEPLALAIRPDGHLAYAGPPAGLTDWVDRLLPGPPADPTPAGGPNLNGAPTPNESPPPGDPLRSGRVRSGGDAATTA